jgi:hypothetical protein
LGFRLVIPNQADHEIEFALTGLTFAGRRSRKPDQQRFQLIAVDAESPHQPPLSPGFDADLFANEPQMWHVANVIPTLGSIYLRHPLQSRHHQPALLLRSYFTPFRVRLSDPVVHEVRCGRKVLLIRAEQIRACISERINLCELSGMRALFAATGAATLHRVDFGVLFFVGRVSDAAGLALKRADPVPAEAAFGHAPQTSCRGRLGRVC